MKSIDNADRLIGGFVHSRGGKVGGLYNAVFNIWNTQNRTCMFYDFDKVITDWQPVPSQTFIMNTDKSSILLS